ncbi:hypothetical protein [Halopseudomonas pelagia]|nr:hypothetical protein [Halopseudomonas pelagia]|tara:strand:- start:2220 stop:2342 length:123 start_codon:yes stop_codon:yes gene_type:complete
MNQRIRDLQVLMLPGKGHWIQSEAYVEASQALRGFTVMED